MAFILKDRVKENSTTTGTGNISLGGASATFDTFQSYLTNGDTTYYAIAHTSSGVDEWEVGLGTWNTGNTLSRTTVLAGSNGTSAVNFSAGTKDIFMTYPASKAAVAGEDVTFANITVTGTVDGRDVAADGSKLDGIDTSADVTDAVTVAAAGALMKSGGTMTGNLILNADPNAALGAATKQYVDTIASAGIHYHAPVRAEHPSNLNATYNNGSSGVGATLTNAGTNAALVIDSVSMVLNDRVLVANQTDQTQNGVYTVTTVGDGSTAWVLTRSTDTDTAAPSDPDAFGKGDAFFIKEGSTNAGHLDVLSTAGTIVFGTTNIVFSEVAETAVYSGGTGITLTGTTFSIGQDVATSANVTFNQVTAAIIGNVTGNLTGDVTGNADTATALETARTIQVSGDVTGSASFDGTSNINITTTVQDDSHAHVISNVDGLQSALDAKVPTSRIITAGNGLTGGGDLSANRTLTVGGGTGITVNANDIAIDSSYTGFDSRYVNVTGDTITGDLQAAGLYVGSTNTSFDFYNNGTSYLNGATTIDANTQINGHLGIGGTATDSAWSDNLYGNTEVSIDGGGGYGVLHFRGDGAGSTNTRYSVGVGDSVFYMAYDDVDGVHRAKINSSHQFIVNEGSGDRRVFHDTYHPNADKWTTARTLSLSGDASGSVSWDGSANATLSVAVSNDSHTHDGRYYTESEADSRFVNVSGDTMTAPLTIDTNTSGMLRLSATNSSPWAIDLQRDDATNSRVYNGGGFWNFEHRPRAAGNIIYDQAYHPEADKWTTARTLSLSGDASGSVSWDGSANATLSVSVGDADTVDGIQGASFLRSDANDSFSGALTSTARSNGIFGTYDSYKTDHIWSMGTAYKNHASGTNFGNLYGLAYKHTNNTTGGTMASGHQMVWCQNGTPHSAMGTNIWTSGSIIVGGTVDGVDIAARNGVLTTTTNTANAALPKAGGTVTGTLTLSQDGQDVLNFSANDTNDHRGIAFNNRTALSADYNDGWLRLNNGSEFSNGIYTPANFRVDGTLTVASKIIHTSDSDTYLDFNTTNSWRVVTGNTEGLKVAGTVVEVPGKISHTGDTDCYIEFINTDEWRVVTSGVERLKVNYAGVRLGDNGNGYLRPVSGNYGSIEIDGGAHGGWEGYSIGGRVVFMHDNSSSTGIYNDVNNEWMFYGVHNSYTRMYHNGSSKVETTSTGVTVNGDVNSTSDIRYKKNIQTIDSALEKVQSLRGVTFDWNNEAFLVDENSKKPNFTERATGVIAQDVEKVLPEAVHENAETGFKNVAYGNMVGLLIEAIKEQQTQIDDLKAEIQSMKS